MQYNVSLDKIKLTLNLEKPLKSEPYFFRKVSTWLERAKRLGYVRMQAENDMRLFKYRFAFTVTPIDDNGILSEGTFYVAWWYNGDYQQQVEQPNRVKVEFNPNKEGLTLYKHFFQSLKLRVVSIDSFDLAFDVLGKSTADILLDTKCDVMTYGTTVRKTHYIAPKERGCGRIKIYDKDAERKEKGVDLDKTLRIEASFRNNDFFGFEGGGCLSDKQSDELLKVCNRLQAVKIRTTSDLSSQGWELYALSRLSSAELENALLLMSKNTRLKYRALIRDNCTETLDIDVATLKLHILTFLAPYTRTMRPHCDEPSEDVADVYSR